MAKTRISLRPTLCCTALLLLLLLLLLLSPYITTSRSLHHQERRHASGHCNIQKLTSQKPTIRIDSEAGISEIWDQTEQQFECAGVFPERHTIQPNGLILPAYSNHPALGYVIQGQGVGGVVIPGCPETSMSSSQGDQHQNVWDFGEGDVIAIPAGVSSWAYNTGKTPLVLVAISSRANQLDWSQRIFFLAGNIPDEISSTRQSRESRRRSDRPPYDNVNIFNGLDTKTLSEAFGVDKETARKLQSTDRSRGFIIKVDNFRVERPTMKEESWRRSGSSRSNGVEELMCNIQVVHNIDNPTCSSDVYNHDAGYLSTVGANSLPILHHINLAASRGHLLRGAVFVPHWHMNSHSIVYMIRGSAQMQIVNDNGESVHDDVVEEGEFIAVPQNFVVTMKAEDDDFDWVEFKTSGNPMVSALAGKTSVLRGLPEDVLRSSYGMSREEARRVKYGRDKETMLVGPFLTSTSYLSPLNGEA